MKRQRSHSHTPTAKPAKHDDDEDDDEEEEDKHLLMQGADDDAMLRDKINDTSYSVKQQRGR